MVGGEGNLSLEEVLRQKKGTETDCFIVLEAPEDQKCHSPNIRTVSWKKFNDLTLFCFTADDYKEIEKKLRYRYNDRHRV